MPDRPLGEREAATELANGRIGIDQFLEFGAQRGMGHGRSLLDIRAFSSEVDSGSRKENASKQETRVPFRFNRNGKALGREPVAPGQRLNDRARHLVLQSADDIAA